MDNRCVMSLHCKRYTAHSYMESQFAIPDVHDPWSDDSWLKERYPRKMATSSTGGFHCRRTGERQGAAREGEKVDSPLKPFEAKLAEVDPGPASAATPPGATRYILLLRIDSRRGNRWGVLSCCHQRLGCKCNVPISEYEGAPRVAEVCWLCNVL